MQTVPFYDFPHSPILIIGFFGILTALTVLFVANRSYFESPLNRDKRSLTSLLLKALRPTHTIRQSSQKTSLMLTSRHMKRVKTPMMTGHVMMMLTMMNQQR